MGEVKTRECFKCHRAVKADEYRIVSVSKQTGGYWTTWGPERERRFIKDGKFRNEFSEAICAECFEQVKEVFGL